MRRGFTLVELMLVTSITSLVLAGSYQLMYAVRFQLRVSEVDLQLAREEALITETWRRDGRAATAARFGPEAEGALAAFETRDGPVRWRVEDGALLREDPAGVVAVASGAANARAGPSEGLWRLELELQREVGDLRRAQRVDAVVAR